MSFARRASLPVQLSSIFCLTAICFAQNAHAQAVHVDLDPAHSQIQFTLGATLHTVHGTFKLKSGTVEFGLSTGKVAEGEIVIDATSGDSGNAGRDRKMNQTVLESAKYPEIVFVPEQIQGRVLLDGASQMQMHGVMRLHGGEHEITVPVETQIHDGEMKATLHFEIPYVQWGLKDPSTFVLRVDKTVEIEADTEGQIAAQ